MKSLIPLFCCLLFYSCERIEDINQQVLFQIEYSNAAWGVQHKIWLVDSSGVLTIYNLPTKWNHPDSNGYLSLIEMNENISQSGVFGCHVDKVNLKKYLNLLDEAKKGKLTDPETRMFDAGSVVFSGFLYDPKRDKYLQAILRQEGDVYIENKSTEAEEIYDWLKTLCIQ
jgi:hypothetical protein